MILNFTKMHGIGNDYIYIDCFKQTISNESKLAVQLSDRHKGIGGDGIVLICKSDVADAKMRMFNTDGSEGKMCGNAIRCVAKYLYDGGLKKERMTIETLTGTKTLRLLIENNEVKAVTVNMGMPIINGRDIPCLKDGRVVHYPLTVDGELYRITAVSMGNPHCVTFISNVDNFDLNNIGKMFESNLFFPERVNAEFVEVISRTELKMRVYERGNGETLACGTGACAAVVAAVLNKYCDLNSDIIVKLPGGNLIINYTLTGVYMTGTADKVFNGVIEINETE